jgi:hypothetical protein
VFFCTSQESVDHLFFHCLVIVDFWNKILRFHPQMRSFSINYLLEFWTSCLLLSNFQYWGTLLAAGVWVIWLERNRRVFNDLSHP